MDFSSFNVTTLEMEIEAARLPLTDYRKAFQDQDDKKAQELFAQYKEEITRHLVRGFGLQLALVKATAEELAKFREKD